nr:zinc finger protein 136-like [Onthophagus taurus]
MCSINEIMNLCRLCLVKNEANIMIFEEHNNISEINQKISACLSITVSKEDQLPKNICDHCMNKLDLLYEFRTTCVSAEKQLQMWVDEFNKSDCKDNVVKLENSQSNVKQEVLIHHDYSLEQNLSYENDEKQDEDQNMDNHIPIKLEHINNGEDATNNPIPNFVNVDTSCNEKIDPSESNKSNSTANNVTITDPLSNNNQNIEQKTIPCTDCNSIFFSVKSLKQHMTQLHHKTYHPFKCDDCDKRYLTIGALNNHKNSAHLGVVYKCTLCPKVYRCGFTFKSHLKSHDETTRYVCKFCGKALHSLSYLQIHERIHKGEKPFNCEHCSKSFVSKLLLKMHERVHTNEKPYDCKICNKGFSQLGQLKIHTRIHTGEKPYGCHLCEKRFTSKTHLNRHLKMH